MPHLGLWIHQDTTQKVVEMDGGYIPGPNEILLRNVVAAVNRSDYAHAEIFSSTETVKGSDAVGIIVQVGSKVKEFNVGEKVLVFCLLGDHRYGCHQEYFLALAAVAWRIPSGLSDSQAATIPTPFLAAADGLINICGLSFDNPPNPKSKANRSILIWGGSSGVGMYAIQLAKALGCSPIYAAASLKHHDYLRTLGADKCLNSRDFGQDEIDELFIHQHLQFKYIFDAVGRQASENCLANCLLAKNGIRVSAVPFHGISSFAARIHSRPQSLSRNGVDFGLNNDMTTVEQRAALHNAMHWALTHVGRGFRPMPVTYIPGGLDGIEHAIDLIRNDKISAEKCIYRFDDTKR